MSKKSQYQLKLKVTVHEISDWSLPDNKPIFVVFEVGEGGGGGVEGGGQVWRGWRLGVERVEGEGWRVEDPLVYRHMSM